MEKSPKTERLDVLTVEYGLAESREQAQRLIRAGHILVDEERIDKPGRKVKRDAAIRSSLKKRRFVSRGGEKLEHALASWDVPIDERVCMDLGASTGGFTDCLLRRGARRVYAVDVGAGQLHESMRTDPRVIVVDRVNARLLSREQIGEEPDVVTADLSFISLRLVLPAVRCIVVRGGNVIVLVKPQFEIGKGRVGKGGIVRDPDDHREVLRDFAAWAREQEWGIAGVLASPILGREGNREFLMHLEPDSERGHSEQAIQDAIESALEAPGNDG